MTNGHYTVRIFGADYRTAPGITAKSISGAKKIARKIGVGNCDVRFVYELDGTEAPAFQVNGADEAVSR